MGAIRGRVLAARGARYEVDTPGGRVECVLRGSLKKERQVAVDPVAVGDWVALDLGSDGRGAIGSVEPRLTKFSRPAPGRGHLEQVIVANADQLVMVQAVQQPELKTASVDRYLVIAQRGGLEAVLCINKMDLERGEIVQRTTELYEGLGIRVFLTSAVTGDGVRELRAALAGRVSVLVGPSGVGKTALMNRIQPDLGLKIQEVSRKGSKGKHTTSWVELFPLDDGGWVADTPGLRELGLWGVEGSDLGGFFQEFEPFAARCRFPTCTHSHEPGCGVAAAVEEGRVSRLRYRSYLRILESLSSRD